jgi:hypothetical protein
MKVYELSWVLYDAFRAGVERERRDRWMNEARTDRRIFGTGAGGNAAVEVSVRTARRANWDYLRALKRVSASKTPDGR